MLFPLLIIAALLSFGLTEANNVSKETLYVLTQLPYPVPNSAGQLPTWTEGVNIIPALNLAARQINSEQDLLPNHNLELVHINGGCDYIDIAVANFTEGVSRLLRQEKRFVGLIGPGCSRSTFGIAPLINRTELSMVTIHAAGASIFSNRIIYPYLFGTLGSVEGFGDLSVDLMQMTNWRKIAILFHDARLYFSTIRRKIEEAVLRDVSNAEIVYSSMVQLNNFLPLDELQRSRARIVFVVTPLEQLRQIICLAFQEGMIYPAYQWVMVSWTLSDFIGTSFVYNNQLYRCSSKNFTTALNNSFFMNYRLVPFDNATRSIAGVNYTEYYDFYKQEVEEYNSDESNTFSDANTTIWASTFYDSLWALAIALHNVTQKYNVSLSDYQYEDENITKLIAEELYNVNLVGNSGPINFNRATGFVEREIDLTQVLNGKEEFTAYTSAGQSMKMRDFEFIDDEFAIRNEPARQGVATFFGIVTFIQLVVIIVLHILTIVYRDHRSVKASSPKLNHFSFVGIYLVVVGILLNVVNEHPRLSDTVKAHLCQAVWCWFLPIGFTLAIVPVVVRTWRLYRIFTHYLNPGHFISNPVLITVICIMVVVDLIIAIIWTSLDPFRIQELESTTMDGDATFLLIRLGCRSDYYFVWLGVILAYKIFILLVMCVLAYLTRNIRNQSFATASLRVFGYLFVIIFTLGFSLYYIFALLATFDPNFELSAFCITLNLLLLSNTVCIFMPPLLPPLREVSKKYQVGKMELKPVNKTESTAIQKKSSSDSHDVYVLM